MNKINKTLNRNATETLTFTVQGNYSADTIYLTAKRKVSDSTRLIDHKCDSITYNAETGLSTFTFNILPAETLGINYSLLTYDIKVENSSIDRDALIQGNLKVNLLPRLDSDLVPDAAENVIELDISELADDTFLYKTTVADVPVLISKTVAEMKAELGLPAKVYKAFVDCNGTNAPTVTVVKNTFTGTMTWSYSETGVVTLTSGSSEFTINKTVILATVNRSTTDRTVEVSRDNVNGTLVTFKTFQTDGNPVDSVDFFVSIEVYE